MEVEKIEELAKLKFDEKIREDILEILKWVEILDKVPDVEPLYSPVELFSPLRDDESISWDFGDVLNSAPSRFGRFIRFISPIGRKT